MFVPKQPISTIGLAVGYPIASVVNAQESISENEVPVSELEPCSLVELTVLSVMIVIAIVLMSISKWLMQLVLRSPDLTLHGLFVTVFSGVLAGAGLVLGTVTLVRWGKCFAIVFGPLFEIQ